MACFSLLCLRNWQLKPPQICVVGERHLTWKGCMPPPLTPKKHSLAYQLDIKLPTEKPSVYMRQCCVIRTPRMVQGPELHPRCSPWSQIGKLAVSSYCVPSALKMSMFHVNLSTLSPSSPLLKIQSIMEPLDTELLWIGWNWSNVNSFHWRLQLPGKYVSGAGRPQIIPGPPVDSRSPGALI